MDAGGVGLVAACETGRRVNSPCVREFIAMPRVVQTDPRRPASRLRCPLASRWPREPVYSRAVHRVVAICIYHGSKSHSHAYVCTYFAGSARNNQHRTCVAVPPHNVERVQSSALSIDSDTQRHTTQTPLTPGNRTRHHLERRGFCDIHFGRNSNGSPSYGPCATLARAKMVCNSPFFHLRHASTAPPWKVPSTKN